jgi:hypothetical protein
MGFGIDGCGLESLKPGNESIYAPSSSELLVGLYKFNGK